MKYLHQFMVIIGITFVGELLKYMLPLPIPASIDGMVIIIPGCDGCGKNAEGRLRYFFEAGR